MTTPAMSPRLVHNETLMREFLKARGITARYPAVSAQLPSHPVNRRAISPYGYNPSLIRFDGRMLMAYRWHPKNTPQTALAMAVLDDDFNVTNNQGIEVPDNRGSVEDPRLFIHGGELWMSYVDSTWPTRPPKCVVKYGRVKGAPWKVEGNYQLEYKDNDFTGMVKNLIFFDHGGKLFCIWQCHPEQVVLEVDGAKVLNEYKSPSPRWAWGSIRGGAGPLPFLNGWMRFFHSGLDNEPIPNYRRYYMGAMVMENTPPFRILALSKAPVLRGSEDCGLTDVDRRNCGHYKAQVVFPAGCIMGNGEWLVSCGVNDSSCVVVRVRQENLNL